MQLWFQLKCLYYIWIWLCISHPPLIQLIVNLQPHWSANKMFQSDLCKHKLKVLHLSLHTVAFCQISISFKCLFLTFNFLLESKNRYVPNFVCVLTNERYKTYRTGLSSYCLCQALGVGLGGGGGVKRSNIINLQLQSQFQWFLYQTLCVLTNKQYKTYRTEFSFYGLGHAPGVGFGGCWGCPKF